MLAGCLGRFDPAMLETPPRLRVEAGVIWIAYVSACIVGACVFFGYRLSPSIRLRSPYLAIASAIGGIAMVTSFLLEQLLRTTWATFVEYPANGITGFNSGWLAINYLVFVPLFLIPYPLRAIRLLFVFRRTVFHVIAKPASVALIPGSSDGEARRERRRGAFSRAVARVLGTGPSEAKFVLVLAALIVLFAAYGAATNQFVFQCQDADPMAASYAIYGGVYMLIDVVLAVALYLLRHVRDEFTINWELRGTIVLHVACVLPWAIAAYTERSAGVRYAFPLQYLMVACVVACFFVSIAWPVVQLISSKIDISDTLRKLGTDNTVGLTLQSVLDDERASEYFMRYLKTEFCTENLAFHIAVEFFRRKFFEAGADGKCLHGAASLIVVAEAIYGDYVEVGSESEINITDAARRRISAALAAQNESPERASLGKIFDEAHRDIMYLMSIDSFPKFQRSAEFREMCASIHATDADDVRALIPVSVTVHPPPSRNSGSSSSSLSVTPAIERAATEIRRTASESTISAPPKPGRSRSGSGVSGPPPPLTETSAAGGRSRSGTDASHRPPIELIEIVRHQTEDHRPRVCSDASCAVVEVCPEPEVPESPSPQFRFPTVPAEVQASAFSYSDSGSSCSSDAV